MMLRRIAILEERLVTWFANLTQKPRWFSAWVLGLLLWMGIRACLLWAHVPWFNADLDLYVITVLWSVMPFMVENAMKYQQAHQMEAQAQQVRALTELTVAIKNELDRSRERDEAAVQRDAALIKLTHAVLDFIEDTHT